MRILILMTPSIPTVRLMVRKSNSLVEARYKFNMWETRVFTKMITMVRMADEDFKPYRIYLRDIIQEFGLDKDKASYELLRDGANTLLQKEVSIFHEDETGLQNETRTHLIVSATTQIQGANTNYIEVTFHPKMKPHILELKSRFTVYDVKNILNLPSSYSIRIYELLKQYEKIGYRTFEFGELKEIIGAREIFRDQKGKAIVKDNYPLYGSFNQKILKKAQDHLMLHTDLCFEFEPVKKGRKVHKIRFIIMRNPRYEAQADIKVLELGSEPVNHEEDAVVGRLYVQIEQHVDEPTVRRWVRNFSEEQIQYGINYTLNQLKSGKAIENVGGYLHTMVSTDNLVTARAAEEQLRKQARKKEEERKKKFAQVEEKYHEIYQQYLEKEEELIRGILDRNPDAAKNAFARAAAKRGSGYKATRSNAENMADPVFRAVFRGFIRKAYPDQFTALKTLDDWVKKLRGQMGRLKG